jgi:valyl-tRNA synthetase
LTIGAPDYLVAASVEMEDIQKVITSLRALRKDAGVPEKEFVRALIHGGKPENIEGIRINEMVRKNQEIIKSLARILELVVSGPLTQGHIRAESDFDVAIEYEKKVDVPAERARLTRDIAKYEKGMAAAERQLGNEAFLSKAPAQVVEGLKKQATETQLLLETARAALNALPPE